MRTMVRPRRCSSVPTRAARSASDGSAPSSRRSCFARGFEFAALAAHAARPGFTAQRVDHRAADAPFGERLELDAAAFVEAVGRVDQTEHAILDEVAEVDRVRHRGRHAAGHTLHERQVSYHSILWTGHFGGHHVAHSLRTSASSLLPGKSCRLREKPRLSIGNCGTTWAESRLADRPETRSCAETTQFERLSALLRCAGL